MCQIATVNFDKSICVKYIAIYLNSFLLQFDFYQLGAIYPVTFIQFVFTIYDPATNTELLKVVNADWERDAANGIKYLITSLDIAPGTYKIDLTATYPGVPMLIQTLITGDIIIKNRNVK